MHQKLSLLIFVKPGVKSLLNDGGLAALDDMRCEMCDMR